MFSIEEVKKIAEFLDIKFNNFTLDDLTFGMNEELEHGTKYFDTNITNDNGILTAKIALAHLNMFPNYYNKEYGLPHLEEILKEKLNEEEFFEENIHDSIEEEKDC